MSAAHPRQFAQAPHEWTLLAFVSSCNIFSISVAPSTHRESETAESKARERHLHLSSHRMIPRAPSLFHLEERVGASTSAPAVMAASGGELLVGLRLIIQPSPRKQLPTVLRTSAVRIPALATTSAANNARVFAGLEFLKRCSCCHKDLDATMDVFVYKGEQGFCSAECRCRHIAKEERREMEMLVRKPRDAFHRRHAAAPKMQGPNRHITLLQTAAR